MVNTSIAGTSSDGYRNSSACLAVAGLPRQSSNYVSALIFSDLLVERLLLPSDREWWETDVGILEF